MGDWIGVIGIVVSVLLALSLLLLTVIGYFCAQWMRAINKNLECLPVIQTELAGMKVKVDQHSTQQEDFGDKQDEFGKRLLDVEKHISNTERIAVMEKAVKTAEEEIVKLRPVVHQIPTILQAIEHLERAVDAPLPYKSAP